MDLFMQEKSKTYKIWLEKNSFSLLAKPDTQKKAYKNFFASCWDGKAPQPFFQYEIYYAKLVETRKSRPFVILQNNFLNRACFEGNYHSITVAPLSSRLKGGDYRIKINPRDYLQKTSEIVVNAIGIIDIKSVEFDRGCLTKLTEDEKIKLQLSLANLLGLDI